MHGDEESAHCSPLQTQGPEHTASGDKVLAGGSETGWAASLVLLSEALQRLAQDRRSHPNCFGVGSSPGP